MMSARGTASASTTNFLATHHEDRLSVVASKISFIKKKKVSSQLPPKDPKTHRIKISAAQ